MRACPHPDDCGRGLFERGSFPRAACFARFAQYHEPSEDAMMHCNPLDDEVKDLLWEYGNSHMLGVPRHLRRCTFCTTRAVGDERHCIFDCPRFCELRQEHADLFGDARAMRSLMWHKDQKSVCALILAIVPFPPPPPPQRPRHEDRSVLIGHCWLNERVEFPPPPPPPPP